MFVTVTLSFTNQEIKAMNKAVEEMHKQGCKYYNLGHEVQSLAKLGMKHEKFYQEQEGKTKK